LGNSFLELEKIEKFAGWNRAATHPESPVSGVKRRKYAQIPRKNFYKCKNTVSVAVRPGWRLTNVLGAAIFV
jgi:hypothetical protein